MFYHDKKLQYPVRVERPDPRFAKMLQQAIGGIQGEIRVCLQYLFQAWGSRGPAKYRDMLLDTGTEEIAHIEMLSTAVALNLEAAPLSMKEEISRDSVAGAVLNGMDPQHILTAGLAAMPVDASGNTFNCSHVYASGNLAADMYSNAMAEMTGRMLACRLYNMTPDPGMKDMLSFLIARDTMHQNQWLAALEDMGGPEVNLPIPNDFPQDKEPSGYNYTFFGTHKDPEAPIPEGRWSHGSSVDGKASFDKAPMHPAGSEPQLAPAPRGSGAQKIQEG